MDFRCFGCQQRVNKPVVFLFGKRTVQVIVSPPVAAETEHPAFIQGFPKDDRSGSIVEIQGIQAREGLDGIRHNRTGQRTGGNDDRTFRDFRRFPLLQGDKRMMEKGFCYLAGKTFPVHSQCVTGWYLVVIRALHDQGAHAPHFLFEETDGTGQAASAETVGAYQFRKVFRMVCRGLLRRFHFNNCNRNPFPDKLPGCFTAGKPGADHRGMKLTHSDRPLLH